MHISSAARSADWIKTEYTNETTSTFFSLGTASSNSRTITPKTFFTWDYLNRLSKVGTGSTTSTYGYDAWGEWVKMTVATSTSATTTTFYPSKFYNITTGSATSVKHIFANGEEIATVSGSGTKATIQYIHTDHLGGSNVTTDSNGTMSELLDYLPYGAARLDQQTSFNEQRKFIGETYDGSTQLSYLNARYYDGTKAKFISQDPVLWEVGLTSDGKNALANPQAMNSYAYGNGNPITNKDQDGRIAGVDDLIIGGTILAAAYAPQIASYAQSLLGPVGQAGVSQAFNSAKSGNYGTAAFQLFTAGEVPEAIVAKGLTLGQDFGKLGRVAENTAGKITGFFRESADVPYHGLDQSITKGVTPQLLLDTVKNPLVTLKQAGGNVLRLTDQAGVVLNRAGKVVTSYSQQYFLPHVKDVLNKVIR